LGIAAGGLRKDASVTTTNVTRDLLVELDDMLSPLAEVARSDDPLTALRRFLLTCGWHITTEIDPTPIVTGVTALVDGIDAAANGLDPGDLGAFLTALDGIQELVNAVDGLIDLIGKRGPAAPTEAELTAFGEDVLHRLQVRWLSRKPVVGDLALVIGLVEVVEVPAMALGGWLERRAGQSRRLRPAAIVDLLTDPPGYLRGILVPNDWADSTDAATTNLFLAQQLNPFLTRVGGMWRTHADALATPADVRSVARKGIIEVSVPVADDDGRVTFGTELELFSAADTDDGGRPGPAVALAPFGGYEQQFSFGAWSLALQAMVALGGVDAGDSRPALRIAASGIEVAPSVDARLKVGAQIDLDTIIGGQGTRFQLGGLDVSAFIGVQGGVGDVGFSIVAKGASLVLSAADLGEAVAAVAAFDNTIEFDLGLEWSARNGLRLAGAASLEVVFSEGIDIGGVVALSGLRLRAGVAEAITLAAVTDATVNLGPVAMAFEDLGLGVRISFPPEGGNLGVADLQLAVEPPKGIGVRIKAGVVEGGGYLYLDPDRGEFAGVLELSFPAMSLSLKAVGIFTTSLPGGAEGYALLLLIYTEFPAIQLPYGFTLNGVGGIVGLQHGISTEALQVGLRTGALDSVLFPDDPVANAPRLLADLRAVFPISPGSLTLGPVLQLGWGSGIVTLSLGLVLQFDGVIGSGAGDPTIARVVLLGQLKVRLPPVDDVPELVKLLVDIIGYYEFSEKELGVDARLRDSHLAGLPLTGSLTVRARFGAEPTFIMAIGGVHPRFTDLPPGLPPQDRLGVQLRHGAVSVQIGAYTAVTSNTFQFGAEASLVATAADFRVQAYLGFDTLFMFEPRFHFEIDFRVGAAIRWKDWDLASVRVTGRLTGPGRWEVVGAASFTVLLWDVDIDFAVAWGAAPLEPVPAAPVLPRVLQALSAPDSWHTSLPSGRPIVTLRQVDAAEVVAHPLGQLQVQQKVVPFGITVDRVGRTRPTDGNRFDLTAARVGDRDVPITRTREHFARGEFLDLSEDQKLTSPSFERFDAGAAVGTDELVAPVTAEIAFEPEYETAYLRQPAVKEIARLPGHLLYEQARWGAAARGLLRRSERLIGEHLLDVQVTEPVHVVADAETLLDVTPDRAPGSGPAVALNFTEAAELTRGASGRLLVMEAVEMVLAR
jgi:hypothetical protein